MSDCRKCGEPVCVCGDRANTETLLFTNLTGKSMLVSDVPWDQIASEAQARIKKGIAFPGDGVRAFCNCETWAFG